ncbi:MAG TPA: LysE family translocator [Kiloniellaceae bacterium]|nr:LysE family translocator [Kiloniellaceae bacterium]
MLTELLGIAGLTLLIMISPGPDLALVARNTVSVGRRAGGWTSAGIVTGNLFHLTFCLLGLGLLVAMSVVAFTILKFVAGAYLIFLGWQGLRATSRTKVNTEGPGADRTRAWYLQGLLNNLLNPKGALFYLGVLTVFVHADSTPLYLVLLAGTTIGVSAVFWLLFVYVLQISYVRARLRAGGRWVGRLLGAVLIALGIRLFFAEAPEVP